MLHFDRDGELRRRFLVTAVQRNTNPALRLKALAEIAAARDPDAFDTSIDIIGTWTREERREGAKIMLQAMVDKRIGRRDQANAWIWRIAEYTREVHEEYAVQRWPETKRLLGLLVNSSGAAHARNARRLVHAARKQDRRLAAALLAAALAHTPEAEEVLRGARTRMARKPPALARELLRNFPKRRGRSKRRRRRGGEGAGETIERIASVDTVHEGELGVASNGGVAHAVEALGDEGVRLDAEARLLEREESAGHAEGVLEDEVSAALSESANGRRPRGSRRRVVVDEEADLDKPGAANGEPPAGDQPASR
jgi:hypothetical protein